MSITVLVAQALFVIVAAAGAAGQQSGNQAVGAGPGAATLARCAQAQPEITITIDAAAARLEAARQTNSPAAMRAAIDDVQAALRDVRIRLAPCAALAPADPHAGHAMPATSDKR